MLDSTPIQRVCARWLWLSWWSHDECEMWNVYALWWIREKRRAQRSRENLQFLLFPKTSLLFHMMGHSRIANVRVGNFTQHKYLLHGVKKTEQEIIIESDLTYFCGTCFSMRKNPQTLRFSDVSGRALWYDVIQWKWDAKCLFRTSNNRDELEMEIWKRDVDLRPDKT